jgi:hypothetical protein
VWSMWAFVTFFNIILFNVVSFVVIFGYFDIILFLFHLILATLVNNFNFFQLQFFQLFYMMEQPFEYGIITYIIKQGWRKELKERFLYFTFIFWVFFYQILYVNHLI